VLSTWVSVLAARRCSVTLHVVALCAGHFQSAPVPYAALLDVPADWCARIRFSGVILNGIVAGL